MTTFVRCGLRTTTFSPFWLLSKCPLLIALYLQWFCFSNRIWYDQLDWCMDIKDPHNFKYQRNIFVLEMKHSRLTHWGRVTHICVSKLRIIGSDNGLSPGRRQAIIWTNAGILLIWPFRNKLQWNVNRNSYIFSDENAFEDVNEMADILSRPQCVKENVMLLLHFHEFRGSFHTHATLY